MEVVFELSVEIALVAEADLGGNLADGEVRVAEEARGLGEAQAGEVVDEGRAGGLLEELHELGFAHGADGGGVGDSDAFGVVVAEPFVEFGEALDQAALLADESLGLVGKAEVQGEEVEDLEEIDFAAGFELLADGGVAIAIDQAPEGSVEWGGEAVVVAEDRIDGVLEAVEGRQILRVTGETAEGANEFGEERDDETAWLLAMKLDQAVEAFDVDNNDVAGRKAHDTFAHAEAALAFERDKELEAFVPIQGESAGERGVGEVLDDERKSALERELVVAIGGG
jgi:hypothetical protein